MAQRLARLMRGQGNEDTRSRQGGLQELDRYAVRSVGVW
jgi:hypothetical protein